MSGVHVTSSPHEHEVSTVHEEHSVDVAIIFFIFCSCGIGALLLHLGQRIHLPYTVLLLLIGIVFGFIASAHPLVHEYAIIAEVDPHLLLHMFLPILIFESAFAMEAHTFIKSFVQVLILALPGLGLASILTCVLAKYLFHDYNWDWNVGMMFGSILSATDPVAVVALLRELGTSKQLAMLIEGESLLNDAAAIVFFTVFLKLSSPNQYMNGGEIIVYFIQVAVGGSAFGYLMAKLTLFWLSRIFNDALVEITITLASTYITYYVGEQFLGVSGVLAVVVLGVAVSAGKANISPEVEVFLGRFWEVLAYLANTLIFILVGLVIQEKAISPGEISGMDWFYLFALYFGVNVIRFMVLGVLMPILAHIGYGMSMREMCVMTWSGVRGAVGLALGLLVSNDPYLDVHVKSKILIHVSGIVILTLLINGSTVKHLLKLLGMSDVSQPKRMATASAVRHLQDRRIQVLNILKTSRFLADADWDYVEKASQIQDPYQTTKKETDLEESGEIRVKATCPECETCLPPNPTAKELKEMKKEALLRMLKAEKMSYRRQFENGLLSREAVRKLKECTEVATDKAQSLNINDIKGSWKVPDWLIKIKRLLKKWTQKPVVPHKNNRWLQLLHEITESLFFSLAVCIVVLLDMSVVVLEVYDMYVVSPLSDHVYELRIASATIVGLYLLEAVLKVMDLKLGVYLQSRWNQFCVFIIAEGLIDVIVHASFYTLDKLEPYRTVLVVFTLFRIIRLARILPPLFPMLIMLIKYKVHKQLNFGYDVGRGFLSGEEEVCKLIHHIVDNKDIAKQLLDKSKAGQLEVIKTLGLLQKQHPDVAMSVKSRQAIRSVLNTLRDSIQVLREDGILDYTESCQLENMVEAKMKRLLTTPPMITPPPPERMLKNVPWLQGDETLIKYIRERAVMVNYQFGDVVMKRGDKTEGIFILVCGMVRMESPISLYQTTEKDAPPMMVDYLMAGNVIGEMGLLTRKKRQATILCETSVQAYFISTEDMMEAFDQFKDHRPSLEYRLWRVCALRIAVNILLEQPTYHGLAKDKVKLHLEPAYLAEIADVTTFIIDSSMADLILIYGSAQDAITKEMYRGPHYIPWTATQLVFESLCKPILLVVPGEGHAIVNDPRKHSDSMTALATSKARPKQSRLCLQHASRTRQQLEQHKANKWGTPSLRKLFVKKRVSMEKHGEDHENETEIQLDPPPPSRHGSLPAGSVLTKRPTVGGMSVKKKTISDTSTLRGHMLELEERDQHSLYATLASSDDGTFIGKHLPETINNGQITTTGPTDTAQPSSAAPLPSDFYDHSHIEQGHVGGSLPSVESPSLSAIRTRVGSAPPNPIVGLTVPDHDADPDHTRLPKEAHHQTEKDRDTALDNRTPTDQNAQQHPTTADNHSRDTGGGAIAQTHHVDHGVHIDHNVHYEPHTEEYHSRQAAHVGTEPPVYHHAPVPPQYDHVVSHSASPRYYTTPMENPVHQHVYDVQRDQYGHVVPHCTIDNHVHHPTVQHDPHISDRLYLHDHDHHIHSNPEYHSHATVPQYHIDSHGHHHTTTATPGHHMTEVIQDGPDHLTHVHHVSEFQSPTIARRYVTQDVNPVQVPPLSLRGAELVQRRVDHIPHVQDTIGYNSPAVTHHYVIDDHGHQTSFSTQPHSLVDHQHDTRAHVENLVDGYKWESAHYGMDQAAYVHLPAQQRLVQALPEEDGATSNQQAPGAPSQALNQAPREPSQQSADPQQESDAEQHQESNSKQNQEEAGAKEHQVSAKDSDSAGTQTLDPRTTTEGDQTDDQPGYSSKAC